MEKDILLLDETTINAAVAGEKWAIEKVIEHYSDEINRMCTVKKKQPNGNIIEIIDEDKRQTLILKLIEELPNFKAEL